MSPSSDSPRRLGFGRSDLEGLGRNAPAHHGLSGGAVLPASATQWEAAIREAGARGGLAADKKHDGGLPNAQGRSGHATLASLYKQSIGLR